MQWLAVMTLPDGTSIELPMPSPEDTDLDGVYGYRVRGPEGITQFSTLTELAAHILEPLTPHPEDPIGDAGGRAWPDDEGHLHITNNIHD